MAESAKTATIRPAPEQPTEAAVRIRDTHTEELVIGICGPIGSGHHDLARTLETALKAFSYEIEVIKLSGVIEDVCGKITKKRRFERIQSLQNSGNDLREKFGSDYLARKAIEIISIKREEIKQRSESKKYESIRKCYIIDSIKNPSEQEIFDLTYRHSFYCLGVFAPLHVRVQNLKRQDMSDAEIYQLIDRDSGEEISHGQQVTKAYVLSDYFMRLEGANLQSLEEQVQRFLHTIFGTKIVTPTKHETAMHHAWVAAANSACLSRNVGAALSDPRGQLISVGWNDVPKFGGGLYQSENGPSKRDERCMYRHGGRCFNDEEKDGLAQNLFNQLVEASVLNEGQWFEFNTVVKNSKLKNLIEFSRSIHAEMHAIIAATDSEGSRVKNGTLYTTTYPCHSCARHIVAAGISEVYYLEPYRKSLATKLHDDSVTEDEKDSKRTRILPYFGAAPKRYFSLFMPGTRERKDSDRGEMIRYPESASKPIESTSIESLPTLESIVVRSVEEAEGASEED